MSLIDDWKLEGLCNNYDPELWYPTQGGTNITEARTICNTCPVVDTCREESIDEIWGVWGGLSESQRRKLRQQNKTTNKAA